MKKSRNLAKSQFDIHMTAKNPDSYDFEERVRYSEVDKMGIAHNKNYFEWFEIGRTEYCRHKNISYDEIEKRGIFFVLAESFCRYKKPLRYDEKFIIRVSINELTPKRIVFYYELFTLDKKNLIATGYTVHIPTNSKVEVCQIPQDILDKFNYTQTKQG